MELNHLKHFYFVAKYGNFTKAAKALRIHQPAVSKTVKTLEESLGVVLLERKKTTVQLTAVGREIFAKCEEIFREAEEIQAIAKRDGTTCSGPLNFCAGEVIASHIVPRIHAKLLRLYPDLIPVSFAGASSQLFSGISSGEFEFGLFFHVPTLPDDLVLRKLMDLPYDLVIARAYAGDKGVRSRFIGSREVDDVATKRFPTLEKWRKVEPAAKIAISSNSLTAHREMVLQGLGLSILPRFLVANDIREGRLQRLMPREDFRFGLKLVQKKNKRLSHNARTWLDGLEADFS